jgi:hypothetical protein
MIGDEDDRAAPVPALTRASLVSSILAIVAVVSTYVAFATGFGSSPSRGLAVLFPLSAMAATACAILAFVLAIAAVVRSRGFARAHAATHAALFLSILLAAPAVATGGPYVAGVADRVWQESIGESVAAAETVEAEYDAQLDDYVVTIEPLVDMAIEVAGGSIPEDAAEQNTWLDACDGGRWVTYTAEAADGRGGDAERIVEAWQAMGLTFTHRSGGDVESWGYVRSSTSPYPLMEAEVTRTPSGDGERLAVTLTSFCVGDGL